MQLRSAPHAQQHVALMAFASLILGGKLIQSATSVVQLIVKVLLDPKLEGNARVE